MNYLVRFAIPIVYLLLMYVLLTNETTYLEEYLFGKLIMTENISQALEFKDKAPALKYKELLFKDFGIICSVNTIIK